MKRVAVVLFNLGGPDRPEAIEPFLRNLFRDPAIISLPWPIRPILAKLIAGRRARVARDIYAKIGGASPLLAFTRRQAAALEAALKTEGVDARTFVCMRYWHPMSDEVAHAVKAFDPERIVLLPLYPQFSTTTTESSFKDWRRAARAAGLDRPTHPVCCYPVEEGFIAAVAEMTRKAMIESAHAGMPRVLFSAHGLPKRVVARGDPYPRQVEATAAAIAVRLGLAPAAWTVCYQSRVGPLEWIGPSTSEELDRAGRDRVPVVVVPIAFVSEHSETLVELDIEYRHHADEAGVPDYIRVPTVAEHPSFIAGLARLARGAFAVAPGVCRAGDRDVCESRFVRCANGRGLDSL
jgi:ferrochelatase